MNLFRTRANRHRDKLPTQFRIDGQKSDQEMSLVSSIQTSGYYRSLLEGHAIREQRSENTSGPVAVHLHLYYKDLVHEFYGRLLNIGEPFDLFITVCDSETKAVAESALDTYRLNLRDFSIRIVINKGRDILPFIETARSWSENYEIVCHLHTKKSPHAEHLAYWRTDILNHLLASRESLNYIFDMLKSGDGIGLIIPQYYHRIARHIHWGRNFPMALALADRMGLTIDAETMVPWPAGSMFWARKEALAPLLNSDINAEDFPIERGILEEHAAHAIERLFGEMSLHAGFKTYMVALE